MSDISSFLNLDREAPATRQAALGPGTQSLIAEQSAYANRPTSSFVQDINKNVEAGLGRLGADTYGDYGKSGVSKEYQQALRNAYSGQTGDTLRRISSENEMVAQQRKANALAVASQYAQHKQALDINQFQRLTDAYAQMEAQRAQFVAAISGLANYGVGTYMGAKSGNVAPAIKSPDQSIQLNQSSYFGDYNFKTPQLRQQNDSYLGEYNF